VCRLIQLTVACVIGDAAIFPNIGGPFFSCWMNYGTSDVWRSVTSEFRYLRSKNRFTTCQVRQLIPLRQAIWELPPDAHYFVFSLISRYIRIEKPLL
jgi:hypothetical protein